MDHVIAKHTPIPIVEVLFKPNIKNYITKYYSKLTLVIWSLLIYKQHVRLYLQIIKNNIRVHVNFTQ